MEPHRTAGGNAPPPETLPPSTLEDALFDRPGNVHAKFALLQVQRAWNVLDCALAEAWQVKIVNGSMVMVPLYDEGTHERDVMLQLMKKQMETGVKAYNNPHGRDDTEDLLSAFDKLPDDWQRRLHAIAERCIETAMTITDADVIEVIGSA